MSLSPEFLKRLNELYQSFIQYDASQCNRLNRYRNIEPESAQYLAMLVRIQQSKNILEIGTSTGYSTLWLADAAQVTSAKITTLEIDPNRTAQARSFAKELAVDDVIDFQVVDALDFLQNTHQKFDFILLDAERTAYVDYWPYLQNILQQPNGVLVVDNVISHAVEVKSLIHLVKSHANFLSTTLSVGAGLFIVSFKDERC